MFQIFLLAVILNIHGVKGQQQCSKIRDLLGDDSITVQGPHNDICILSKPSCCNKAVENALVDKTREILKNRVFLVLNQFYQTIDLDSKAKQSMLRKIITKTNLAQTKKVELSEKFSEYQMGGNSLTTKDLDDIKTAAAVGSLSASLNVAVSAECQSLLYFEMEHLKNSELKYLSSILLMLRGYNIMTNIITKAQVPDLTDECYVGAVRGGLKFGGCELCDDATEFAHPCVKLCRNLLSGCLKGHIQIREYIQYLAQYQIELNKLVETMTKERDTKLESLKAEVKSKLSRDREFYDTCSTLQGKQSDQDSTKYEWELQYTAKDARNTLDSAWLCTYVFSGISEVNCWNKSAVGEYRLSVYEFSEDGQFENPEVPGEGPSINIDEQINLFKDYKYKVEELSAGRDILKPSSAKTHILSLTLLTLIIFVVLT